MKCQQYFGAVRSSQRACPREDIVKVERSYTGQFLKDRLERRPQKKRVEAAE